MKTVKRFLRCESGATAIEYAVMAGGIAVAVAVVVYEIGSTLNTNYFARIASAFPGQ
ncbi:Flp family type IVb pilin [Bradyrhizobium prioriisuperbiae]|uniref:Flp family type IVb pilin n=1 Tax=Bradyrhizobium prioriisuperbiae TaxID=2854389 RepID=UPI0028F133E3|nr:Flp family type IVb pilin [Bradyrhizobium prioritasuperba]